MFMVIERCRVSLHVFCVPVHAGSSRGLLISSQQCQNICSFPPIYTHLPRHAALVNTCLWQDYFLGRQATYLIHRIIQHMTYTEMLPFKNPFEEVFIDLTRAWKIQCIHGLLQGATLPLHLFFICQSARRSSGLKQLNKATSILERLNLINISLCKWMEKIRSSTTLSLTVALQKLSAVRLLMCWFVLGV